MQIITCGFQSMDTSSLKVKFSIQNVFTVIFEICGCKNQFREMLGPQNSNLYKLLLYFKYK
jgi:hypothetical protein